MDEPKTKVFNRLYRTAGVEKEDGTQSKWFIYFKRFAKVAVIVAIAVVSSSTFSLQAWTPAVAGGLMALDKALQEIGWY